MKRVLPIATLLILGAACASGTDGGSGDGPTLMALSTYEAKVGDQVVIYGTGFTSGSDTTTDIDWKGQFTIDGTGQRIAVEIKTYTDYIDGNSIAIPYFGPFSVPFSPTGDQLGTFEGDLTALVSKAGSAPIAGPSLHVKFKVLPSVVITDIQPVGARCSTPVKRMLGGFSYTISAKALGFHPINFSYQLLGEPTSGDHLMVRHPATGTSDHMGANNIFSIDAVPAPGVAQGFRYKAMLVVTSLDDQGVAHTLSLPFSVHNPVEFIYSGDSNIAQIYPAKAMSGCLTGSTGGTSYTYSESTSETREREVHVTWNEEFLKQHMTGTAHTDTNSVNFSNFTSDSTSWMSNVEAGANLGVDLGIISGITVKGGFGMGGMHMWGHTVGEDHSKSDTVSQSDTDGHTLANGGEDVMKVSSTDYKLNSFTTMIFAGMFAVSYRQTTRLQLPGKWVAYNMCGEPTVAGGGSLTDWVWSVDLAQAPSCPPLPAPNLPPAQCKIGPCE